MHELAISEAICEQVRPYVVTGKRLSRIVLECGPFCGIVPDSLKYCFEMVAPHAGFGGVTLELVVVAAAASCPRCDAGFRVESSWASCQRCGHSPITVTGGRELRVKQIEVEELENVSEKGTSD